MTGSAQIAGMPDAGELPGFDALPAIADLPDPFAAPDGRISMLQQWDSQRARLLRSILHYEYGPLPPVSGIVTTRAARPRRLKALGATETELVVNMGPDCAIAVRLVLTAPQGAG